MQDALPEFYLNLVNQTLPTKMRIVKKQGLEWKRPGLAPSSVTSNHGVCYFEQ